jgi:hypothetical protein
VLSNFPPNFAEDDSQTYFESERLTVHKRVFPTTHSRVKVIIPHRHLLRG